MLAKFKTEKLVLDWRKRRTTRADVRVSIEKMLDDGLPEEYTSELFEQKCGALFQHMLKKYPQRDGRRRTAAWLSSPSGTIQASRTVRKPPPKISGNFSQPKPRCKGVSLRGGQARAGWPRVRQMPALPPRSPSSTPESRWIQPLGRARAVRRWRGVGQRECAPTVRTRGRPTPLALYRPCATTYPGP